MLDIHEHDDLLAPPEPTDSDASRAARSALERVVLQEYLEKLPEFITTTCLATICGMSLEELDDAVTDGRLNLTKQGGFSGIATHENATFLGSRSLLQLPLPRELPENTPSPEQIGVSRPALQELTLRAEAADVSIAEIVNGLLDPG
jgi:hypothetical protein